MSSTAALSSVKVVFQFTFCIVQLLFYIVQLRSQLYNDVFGRNPKYRCCHDSLHQQWIWSVTYIHRKVSRTKDEFTRPPEEEFTRY